MSTIELPGEATSLAEQEAARRGVSVDVVVDEAVRRSIAGEDLRRLLAKFTADDARHPGSLSEADAWQLSTAELAAARLATEG